MDTFTFFLLKNFENRCIYIKRPIKYKLSFNVTCHLLYRQKLPICAQGHGHRARITSPVLALESGCSVSFGWEMLGAGMGGLPAPAPREPPLCVPRCPRGARPPPALRRGHGTLKLVSTTSIYSFSLTDPYIHVFWRMRSWRRSTKWKVVFRLC